LPLFDPGPSAVHAELAKLRAPLVRDMVGGDDG
jgi:hypothetical protein